MTCQECEVLLAGGDPEASTADHLRECAACRAIQEELQANALALSSLRDDELPRVNLPQRRLPWMAAAAAAVLLALIAHQGLQQQPAHPQPVIAPATGPIRVTAKLPSAPVPKTVRRKGHHGQPLLVKMLTPDPDVVVYWLVD